jgi:hypothetical protein
MARKTHKRLTPFFARWLAHWFLEAGSHVGGSTVVPAPEDMWERHRKTLVHLATDLGVWLPMILESIANEGSPESQCPQYSCKPGWPTKRLPGSEMSHTI